MSNRVYTVVTVCRGFYELFENKTYAYSDEPIESRFDILDL